MEVAALLTEGLRNKEIAARLNISAETVKTHLHNSMGKLRVFGVDNRLKLAAWIVRERSIERGIPNA